MNSKFLDDTELSIYPIQVKFADGAVTLSGEVETDAQRTHAVTIARNTDGVADVIDQLRVNPTAATTGRVGDVDVDIDDDLEDKTKAGADAVTDAAKKGAQETKEGAKKTGEAVKDVFTDKDRDSDKDGK